MLKRIKAIFDSIVYAGMSPSGAKAQPAGPRRFGALRARIERFLNGGAGPSDPFYLSNRTTGQRVRFGAMIAVPVLILVACLALVLSNVLLVNNPKPVAEKPAAQIAAELLPKIARDIRIDTNRDVEIENVRIFTGGASRIMGIARNTTGHTIHKAELTFELTDRSGSRQGAVNTFVENLGPKSSVPFQLGISQQEAVFALVREIKVID